MAAGACQSPLLGEALSALHALGVSADGARLAMAGVSAALCAWLWRLGSLYRRWAGWALGLAMLLALTLSGAAFRLSPAPLSALFGAMALYYWVRWLQTRRAEAAAAWHVGLLLALYAHAGATLLWAGIALAFWLTRWRNPGFYEVFRRRWAWHHALIALLWLPGAVLTLPAWARCFDRTGSPGEVLLWVAMGIAPLALTALLSSADCE